MKNIYTVYDEVAKEAHGLFLANNDSHAKQMFYRDCQKNAVIDMQLSLHNLGQFNEYDPCIVDDYTSLVATYPEDYDKDNSVQKEE